MLRPSLPKQDNCVQSAFFWTLLSPSSPLSSDQGVFGKHMSLHWPQFCHGLCQQFRMVFCVLLQMWPLFTKSEVPDKYCPRYSSHSKNGNWGKTGTCPLLSCSNGTRMRKSLSFFEEVLAIMLEDILIISKIICLKRILVRSIPLLALKNSKAQLCLLKTMLPSGHFEMKKNQRIILPCSH